LKNEPCPSISHFCEAGALKMLGSGRKLLEKEENYSFMKDQILKGKCG
jgi:hypothetical protein